MWRRVHFFVCSLDGHAGKGKPAALDLGQPEGNGSGGNILKKTRNQVKLGPMTNLSCPLAKSWAPVTTVFRDDKKCEGKRFSENRA
jgi:hypothetical protein